LPTPSARKASKRNPSKRDPSQGLLSEVFHGTLLLALRQLAVAVLIKTLALEPCARAVKGPRQVQVDGGLASHALDAVFEEAVRRFVGFHRRGEEREDNRTQAGAEE